MPLALAVVLAAPELVDDDLFVAPLVRHRGFHFNSLDMGSADFDIGTAPREEHLAELQLRAYVGGELFDLDRATGFYAVLLTAGLDDGLFEAGHDWQFPCEDPQEREV